MQNDEIDERWPLLAALNESQLRSIAAIVKSELPCTRNQLRKKLEPIGVDAGTLTDAIGYFLNRAAPGGPFHNRVWEEVKKKVGEENSKNLAPHEAIVKEIFSTENAIAYKGAILQQRLLPHVAEFETFVDLRPIFDESHTEILAYVRSVILQIALHSDTCDQIDVKYFQLAPSALDGMIKVLDDAKTKLKITLESAKKSGLKVLP